MKIIAIGDTHGKNIWEKIVEQEKDADKIIFMGDYWDSFTHDYTEQVRNFNKILEFKKNNWSKVKLLLGNHDYQYITKDERYSGFQDKYSLYIGKMVQDAINNEAITLGYTSGDFVFTHAGVTEEWWNNNIGENGDLVRELNTLIKSNPDCLKFTPSSYFDNTGDSITQSPIWVRPRALMSNAPEGLIQVVGHTKHKKLTITDGFIFTDCLDYVNEYLIINNGVPKVGKLNEE